MKVSCLQENLSKALGIVSRAVATRTTLPVLSNVLLSTEDGRLKVAATNLEVAIVTYIGAKVEEEGSITVPARLLTEFVSSLPNDRVDMSLNEKNFTLHLSCLRSNANIKGIDAQDFPPILTVDIEGPSVGIDPQVFREMVSQVAFAAANDDSRPVLAGVLVSFRAGELVMSATDGFRLSVKTTSLEPTQQVDIIVPAKTLSDVARLAADEVDPIIITVTPNKSQVLFHMPTVDVVSRLIEGVFPNYQHIIPQTHETHTEVAVGDFLGAVRRASFFAREAANIVRLTVQADGHVVIAATSAEVGDNTSDIDASVTGKEIAIAFNAVYLMDALSALSGERVSLETIAANNPGVMRIVGDDSFLHVIMPLQLPKVG